jgi:protease-4
MTAKRWVALAGAAILFLVMVFVAGRLGGRVTRGLGPWQEAVLEGEGADKIAVINVVGEIVQTSEEQALGSAVADDLVSQLRQARRDPAVKAVILRLNTPGGSVVASDQVYQEVRELRGEGLPVVASMGEVAASGGYFIAASADRIVANGSTFTGSIGVILVLVNLEEAAGKLGIEPVVIKSGRLKDVGSPFRRLTEEERGIYQSLIDEAYETFIEAVAEGRDMSTSEVREVADGRPISGAQAEELGLVDRLGNLDAAIEEAQELAELEEATVVEYRVQPSLADLLRPDFPTVRGPVDEAREAVGVTGPVLKYLYVA